MQLQIIQNKIHEIREHKVMLDFEIAELYGVETRVINQAVKRNIARFPADFMFQITEKEFEILKSQFVISSWGGARHTPYAFTEQGVAMLSSVLRSSKAVSVNIAIMRVFVFMRQYALSHKELTQKLKELENRYDKQFKDVFEAITYLMQKDEQQTKQQKRKRIGYKIKNPSPSLPKRERVAVLKK